MDGWIDINLFEKTDGCLHGQENNIRNVGWIDKWMTVWIYKWMTVWIYKYIDGWMDRKKQKDGWININMDGWMERKKIDGWLVGQI